MSYVNQGPDPRLLGAWGGSLQGALSFKHPREYPVRLPVFLGDWLQLLMAIGPRCVPFVSLFVRWPKGGAKRWASVRVGWRFDRYWGDTLRCADQLAHVDFSHDACAKCMAGRPWECLNAKPEQDLKRIGGYIADVIIKLRMTQIVHY